jgi:transcription elongation factor Elf1
MNEVSKLLRQIQRRFECEFCGAQVGRRCVSKNGKLVEIEHQSRYQQAVDAGLLPIDITPFYSDRQSA